MSDREIKLWMEMGGKQRKKRLNERKLNTNNWEKYR